MKHLYYLLTVCVSCLVFSPIASADWSGTDEEFIAMVEKLHWDFFPDAQGSDKWWKFNDTPTIPIFTSCGTFNGKPPWGTPAVAGDGFGIACLCIGAYRDWIDEEEAYQRIYDILHFYAYQASRNEHNFYSQFYHHWSGEPCDSRNNEWQNLDWATIDSTWFICGALLAAEYFKGTEVDDMANYIYDTTKYNSGYDPYTMGWCEYMIMPIIGGGSRYYAYPSPSHTSDYFTNSIMNPFKECPLFWLQWPQHFVDFRYLRDPAGRDHFGIARGFMIDHRTNCIHLHNTDPSNYPDYGTNSWFLTATDGSQRYDGFHPFSEWANDSGTVMPIAAPSCMAHTPYEARLGMLHFYNDRDDVIWSGTLGCYGFINAFNTGQALDGEPYTNTANAAMDIGDAVMGIECFRSGMPWKYFMRHERVQIGLDRCGFTAITNIPTTEDFNDGSDPNVWGGSLASTNSTTCSYVPIDYFNEWVTGTALRVAASSADGMGRMLLNETDQSPYDLLSFWLRGASGGEEFQVGLADAEGHTYTVAITNYTEDGTVSTNWQRIRIPLKTFVVTDDPNTDVRPTFLGDFRIVFDAPGTIEIDDLSFILDDIPPTPPDTVGAACMDGRLAVRWGYSEFDDVVGYHIWRNSTPTGGYQRVNSNLVSAVHEFIDATVDPRNPTSYFYAVQCIDRSTLFSTFSSDEAWLRATSGPHRDLDWNDGHGPNSFGGWDGIWGAAGFAYTQIVDDSGITSWVRQCTATNSGAGVFTMLDGGDLRSYAAISMRIRGATAGGTVDVGFKSTNTTEIQRSVTNYMTGSLSTNWSEVYIPLTHFHPVDFSAMEIMFFAFDSASTVEVDRIQFHPFETPDESSLFCEAEQPDAFNGGNTNDYKFYASAMHTLGDSWGYDNGDYADYTFALPSTFNEAVLDVRYACDYESGRTLAVSIDSRYSADLTINYTEGWGSGSNDFMISSANLGMLTGGTVTVRLSVTNDSHVPVNVDYLRLHSAEQWFREAEHCDAQLGADQSDSKAAASGGAVLGYNWGMDAGDYAIYSNIVFQQPVTGAILRLCYAQQASTGRLITVWWNNDEMGALACPPTGGWLDHSGETLVSELPLGTLDTGPHTLQIGTETAGTPCNLDWLQIQDCNITYPPIDTDGDGIPDIQETIYGTSSSQTDTDGDGLDDLTELTILDQYLTDPCLADSDGDDLSDQQEILVHTDPTSSTSFFGVVGCTFEAVDDGMQVRWQGSTDITYEVFYNDADCAESTNYQTITDGANIQFTNGLYQYLDNGTGTTPAPSDTNVKHRTYQIRAITP